MHESLRPLPRGLHPAVETLDEPLADEAVLGGDPLLVALDEPGEQLLDERLSDR
jgi:hypothetical protein